VAQLEALELVALLSLLADDIEHLVNELSALGVVALGPVVAGAVLTEDEVIGFEELAVLAAFDVVDDSGLEVHQDGTRDILPASSLIEVDVDLVELEIRIAAVSTGAIDAVLLGDDLPELGTDLVTALSNLDVHNLTHSAFDVSARPRFKA
jgi:hypothetical protein